MKRSPWFPVWAGFQDDEQFLAVSAEAELLYIRATARCKQLDQPSTEGNVGRHQLRRLCDKMTADPAALAAELVVVGLWDETETGWRIRAYGDWNTSADEERIARAEASRLANHTRWKHEGPVDGCPKCNRDVSLDQSGRTPGGDGSDSDRTPPGSPIPSLDVDETRRDVDETTPPTPHPPGPGPEAPDPAAVLVVDLADDLIEALGLVNAVANEGERKLTARALARGWSRTALLDAADEVAGRDDVDSPRRYLGAVLRRMANTDPPTIPGPAPAGTRPLLDDERAPCDLCGGSGIVGGIGPDGMPDGSPVTTCTHAPAVTR